MNHIVTNILEFEGEPFSQPLKIVKYYDKKDTLNYYEIGRALRNLRNCNRFTPIIQFEKSLITIEELKDDTENMLINFEKSTDTVQSSNFKDRDIIRRLIGETIAVQLRNSKDYLWKVEEKYNNIFEVSDTSKIQKFGEIEIYPGFTYSSIVLPNGKAGIILDLKHKFYSVQNLRERLISGLFTYSNINETRRYIDTCPLSIGECYEKRNSFSTCPHAGTGKIIPIKAFLDIKPSEVSLSSNENLIEFHQKKDVCLKSPGGMSNKIKDDKPVAVSEFITEEGENYYYPLERLREIPSFDIINEYDRNRIMDLIRPQVHIRYRKTKFYMRYIKEDTLGRNIRLKPIIEGSEWVKTLKQDIFHTPELVIGNNVTTDYPSFYIEKNGLYDKFEKDKELNIKILHFSEISENIINQIAEIFSNNCTKRVINFTKYTHIPTKIIGHELITSEQQIDEILNELSHYDHICILLLHSEKDKYNYLEKTKFIKRIISKNIPKQGINCEEFLDKIKKKQNAYLRNIYLGIIAKVGLMSWILNIPKDNTVYIGMSSRFFNLEKQLYNAAFCTYTNQGRFLKGIYISCDKNEKSNEYCRIFENINNNNNVILMKHGRLWETEFQDLENTIKNQNINVEILELISSPLRIYSIKDEKVRLPTQGTYIVLSDNEMGLVTTRSIQGTKDPIVLRILTAKLEKIMSKLPNIYALSQCYTGWEKYTTKFPVPIHASDKVLQKGISMDLNSFDFDKAWFV
ncbi:MAG: hypothetical protein ACTSRR_01385 [Candidatus Heimdallarchaeaceae archaeon]